MTTRSYAHMGCATVILGGAGLLFATGGLEAVQQGYFQGWLGIVGGLALWALVALLFWLSKRQYDREEQASGHPPLAFQRTGTNAPQGRRKGGFWRTAAWAWAVVAFAHVSVFVLVWAASLYPGAEAARGWLALLAVALVPAHVVVPPVAGLLGSVAARTSRA